MRVKDLDSPKDEPIIIVDESEEAANKIEYIHATSHPDNEDTLVPKPSSPSSLPTVLKELPFKFNELTREVKELKKHVHDLEIELLVDLKEIPNKLETFTSIAKIKTLDTLQSLLNKGTKSLNKFAQVIGSASQKTGDTSVPSAGQAGTQLAEGEKNTNQVTISQLFQRKPAKDAEKANLNKQQSIPIPPPITTTKDKSKKAMSSKDAKEEGSESDSDDTIHLTGSMVESYKKKKLKKFDFITKYGDHVHLTEEQINKQKRIKKSAKAAAKHEVEVRREELVDLFGPDVVSKYYKAKLQYDKYCDKMLNKRAKSRITNCDVLTRNSPITLKVYKEDGTDEVILKFKANDLYLAE
ncbi:hypothetical protein Tco_0657271 [Tanacetum coccineum]|uniref:Uncharacterized protein n=1 Tax=Tanacetum coccineum TaxID=301880 RepID=A0ABQ4XCF8_9ASTR